MAFWFFNFVSSLSFFQEVEFSLDLDHKESPRTFLWLCIKLPILLRFTELVVSSISMLIPLPATSCGEAGTLQTLPQGSRMGTICIDPG